MTSRYVSNSSPAVEDEWIDILTSQGVARTDAESITIRLQASLRTALGSPSAAAVERTVKENIGAIDLDAHGVDNPDAVKRELERVLEEGVHGNRPGPASVTPSHGPTAAAATPSDKQAEPAERDVEDGGQEPAEEFTLDMPEETVGGGGDGIGAGAQGAGGDVTGHDAPSASETDEEAERAAESAAAYDGPFDEPQVDAADSETDPASDAEPAAEAPLEQHEEALVEEQLAEESPTDDEQPPGAPQIDSLRDIALHTAVDNVDQPPADADEIVPFAVQLARRSLEVHEQLIKQTMFPAHSPAEREIFYQAIIEDHGLQLLADPDD